MNRYSTHQDLTHKQAPVPGGASHRRRFMCGHSASTTGGLFRRIVGRGAIAWTCAACLAAAAEKVTS